MLPCNFCNKHSVLHVVLYYIYYIILSAKQPRLIFELPSSLAWTKYNNCKSSNEFMHTCTYFKGSDTLVDFQISC